MVKNINQISSSNSKMLQIIVPTIVLLSLQIFSVNAGLVSPKVIGGSDAQIEDFPSIVSVRINNTHHCGGTILDQMRVLTAAHCVYDTNERALTIQYASAHLDPLSMYVVEVFYYIIHDNFTIGQFPPYANDLAILVLVGPIRIGPNSQKILMPTQGSAFPENSPAMVLGWGSNLVTRATIMNTLQKATLTVYAADDCSSAVGSDVDTQNNICAGDTIGGNGQCTGDAGGPIVVNGAQIGVISWSLQPCGSSVDVSVNIAQYVDWICRIAYCVFL